MIEIPRRGSAEVTIDGRALRLTNLDRVLWPNGFTKADAIDYWLAIAGTILPHLADRPLTLGRFPTGVGGRGFAQSEVKGRPPWVRTADLVLADGSTKAFTLADERATLVWLAQMGVLELHAFLGRIPELARPDFVVFDLDPGEGAGLAELAEVALLLRARLPDVDVRVKTSGGSGLHVLVAVEAASYAETRAYAAARARELVVARPELVVTKMARTERIGRVLLDIRQNAERLSLAAPYTLRAALRPTVSTPVTWDELEHPETLSFEAQETLARVASRGDLFAARKTPLTLP